MTYRMIAICLCSWCILYKEVFKSDYLFTAFWQDQPQDASKDSFLMHRTYYDINVFKSAGYPFTNVFLPKLDC